LNINGTIHEVNASPKMPLLWVLRDLLQLTGTKYGCGLGICGICTVQINGQAERSCQIPIENCLNQSITTIEGLSKDGQHPIQRAWRKAQVPQCGYCQGGQMMQAAALLKAHPNPDTEQVNHAMSTVLCRCGTYPRIQQAIQLAIKFEKDAAESK